MAAMVGGLALW